MVPVLRVLEPLWLDRLVYYAGLALVEALGWLAFGWVGLLGIFVWGACWMSLGAVMWAVRGRPRQAAPAPPQWIDGFLARVDQVGLVVWWGLVVGVPLLLSYVGAFALFHHYGASDLVAGVAAAPLAIGATGALHYCERRGWVTFDGD